MLSRKIERSLAAWKADPERLPVIVKGCRQCGKTYSVRKFAEENYGNCVYLNFYENAEYCDIFAGSLEVDHLIMMMSAMLGPVARFEPGNTVIILDEIQECPEARTALKFFKMDGRFDVIGTGSLLGVKGYSDKPPKSIPVGYESTIDMYPLDFEEFLWAMGIAPDLIHLLHECLQKASPVSPALHKKLRQLFLEYLVIGGMPAAVQSFAEHHEPGRVLPIQRDIVRLYEQDMIKYASAADKSRIIECFESIPRQLARENKKFQYSVIKKGGRSGEYSGSLQWIEDAGIIYRCHNLERMELPLKGNSVPDEFKVYMADPGLFLSMLDDGTQFDVLNGSLYTYKGAIVENYVAGVLAKMGRELYYYRKTSGMEIDFVIRLRGKCTPLECNASTGNTKTTRTVLNHPEIYLIDMALKLGDYNVGYEGQVLTLPLYMGFLLTEL